MVTRRWLGRLIPLATLISLGAAQGAAAAPLPTNPITVENAKPGTIQWYVAPGPNAIVGYASRVSALPGETVDLHVSTSQYAPYHIEVYRRGWYGGDDGRLVECLPSCTTSEWASPQPFPPPDPATGFARADWPVTDELTVGSDWVSGYYEIKLVLDGGPNAGQSYPIALIVRQPPDQPPSDILVQVPVNTWQAYNNWGGKSLYNFNSTDSKGAVKVSFDRPYATGMDVQGPVTWELPLVQFLEKNGYDVSYTTDVDVDRDPASLLDHKLVISAGHGEYWSKSQRDAFETARDAGVNLAFFGSNIGYWQVRYEDGGRTIVEYRDPSADPQSDPLNKTTRFRQLATPRPECQLLGVEYQGGGGSNDYSPVTSSLPSPWFAGTGLVPGATIPNAVGYEADSLTPGCTPATASGTGVTDLFHYQGATAPVTSADAVTYTAPSGARVFSTGSLQWNWALDGSQADPRIERFTENVLSDLSARAPETSIDAAPGATSSPSVSVDFSSSDPATSFECRLDSASPADWLPCSSPQAYGPLSEGTHWFAVRSISATGIPDPTPAVRAFVVDTTPPDPFSILHPARGSTVARPRISWQASTDPCCGLSHYEIWVDHAKVGEVAARRTGFILPSTIPDGPHTVCVKAVDIAGNVRASKARSFTFRRP